MSEITQQLAQALRETETERQAMRELYEALRNEYEQTRKENAQLAEQVEHLSGLFQQVAEQLSILKRR
ncbi:MAG: hypothetical protein EOM14_09700 [Clostridia bacterium]|nr:hypothetical protein [Clostridia bacterium]